MIIFEHDKRGYERNIELSSRLFEDRNVFFVGRVEPYNCQEVVQQLLILDSQNNDDIFLYINTGGGEVISGLSVISAMDSLKSRVNTVNLAECASMGGVIYSAGFKRYSYKYSEFMLHSIKSGFYGHAKDIEVSAERTKLLNDKLLSILAKNCGYSLDEMKNHVEHDLWLDADEAKNFGLVDYII